MANYSEHECKNEEIVPETDNNGFDGLFSPLNEYAVNEKEAPEQNVSNSIFSWVETLFASFSAAMLILVFLFRMNVVSGISMEPTLYDGDRLIMLQTGRPSYGDIVAIKAENIINGRTGRNGEFVVKRVIGLPGDVIDIDGATGSVIRNGEVLDEPYIYESIDAEHMGNVEYPLTIEENCVFVLGDNRNHSLDSRIAVGEKDEGYLGCVNINYILGKAVLRIWPIERFGVIQLVTKERYSGFPVI